MPYTLFDFVFWILVTVTGGLILKIILIICNRTGGWLTSINELSEEVKENRERIEELEDQFRERFG